MAKSGLFWDLKKTSAFDPKRTLETCHFEELKRRNVVRVGVVYLSRNHPVMLRRGAPAKGVTKLTE